MMFLVGIFSCGQQLGCIEDLWATPSPLRRKEPR